MPNRDRQDRAEQLDQTVLGGPDDANYDPPDESMGAEQLAGEDGGAERSLAERVDAQEPETATSNAVRMIDESESDPSPTTVGELGEDDESGVGSSEEAAVRRR